MSALPPPVNPSDLGRGPLIIGLTWTFTSFSLIVVGLRFWVRITIAKLLSVEDWLMLAAAILNLACQSLATVAYEWGLGKHDLDLTFDQIVNVLKWVWITSTPGITASIVARISIAILLVRIFGTKTWLKWFLITATVLQAVSNIAVIITTWVQVRPVEGVWNPTVPAWRLNPKTLVYLGYVGGALFAFGDLTYVLFPVIVVWKLNMQLRRKVSLCILLGLSLITMAIAITKAANAQGRTDALYSASLGVLWSLLEQTFVIMLGCAPALSSIGKVKLTSITSISVSLRRLIGSRGSSTGSKLDGSNGLDQYDQAPYYELGVGGQTTSQVHAVNMDTSADQVGSHSGDTGKIHVTDQYAVSTERKKQGDQTWPQGNLSSP